MRRRQIFWISDQFNWSNNVWESILSETKWKNLWCFWLQTQCIFNEKSPKFFARRFAAGDFSKMSQYKSHFGRHLTQSGRCGIFTLKKTLVTSCHETKSFLSDTPVTFPWIGVTLCPTGDLVQNDAKPPNRFLKHFRLSHLGCQGEIESNPTHPNANRNPAD